MARKERIRAEIEILEDKLLQIEIDESLELDGLEAKIEGDGIRLTLPDWRSKPIYADDHTNPTMWFTQGEARELCDWLGTYLVGIRD